MKAHIKLAVIAAAGVFCAAIAVALVLTDHSEQRTEEEKKSWLIQTRRSVRAIAESLSNQYADKLSRTLELEATSPGASPEMQKTEFLAMGLVQAGAGDAPWTLGFWEATQMKLGQEWMTTQLVGLPLERVSAGGVTWAKVTGPDQQTFFALLLPLQVQVGGVSENKIALGILPAHVFSSVNLISKGEDSSIFIVDGAATALSYPDQQYVGAKVESHPVVAQLLKTRELEGLGKFRRGGDEVLVGGYEAISNTNLYVVAALPAATKTQARIEGLIHILALALGLALIVGLAAGLSVLRQFKSLEIVISNLKMLQPAVTPIEPAPAAIVKSSDASVFARAVSGYLRAPIANLVGQAQILATLQKDKTGQEPLDRIIAEGRRIREFVENLARTGKSAEPKIEKIELTPLTSQLLSEVRGEIVKNKIHLEENFKADLEVRADYTEIKESLSAAMQFCVQTLMAGPGDKKLFLSLESLGGMAQIVLRAKGAELKADVRRKLFSPFEVQLQATTILGLDLALAHSRMLAHNGEMLVESLAIDEFQIVLRLPTIAKPVEVAPAITEVKVEPAPRLELAPPAMPVLPKPVSTDLEKILPPPPQVENEQYAVTTTVTLTNSPVEVPVVPPVDDVKNKSETEVVIRRPKVRLDP